MKLVKVVTYVFLLCFLFQISECASGKVVDDIAIHDLNLLLPLTSGKFKSSYPLKAYNGCFKWYLDNNIFYIPNKYNLI